MVTIEVPTFTAGVAAAIGGLFIGLGSAVGASIAELWIKPHLRHLRRRHGHFWKRFIGFFRQGFEKL